MAESIHTARWINQITDQNWGINLFPSKNIDFSHSDLKKLKLHHFFYCLEDNPGKIEIIGINLYSKILVRNCLRLFEYLFPRYRAKRLAKLIKIIKPDIIHSMEFQHAGYLTYEAKKILGPNFPFPKWIVTNWGSDIYFFGKIAEDQAKIKQILKECDFYSCECNRDVCLAQYYGLKARVLPVFPNSGGIDLKKFDNFRRKGKTSERKIIVFKGAQSIFGRALVGIQALEKCAKELQGYKIIIFSPTEDVVEAAKIFSQKTGISVSFIPSGVSRTKILKLHGQARFSLGLNVSDAISTAVLEAMALGSFPIQSDSSCAGEWFENDKTGILVPAEDSEKIAVAIKKALNNDFLVDQAAKINRQIIRQKLDEQKIKQKTINFYKTVYQTNKAESQK